MANTVGLHYQPRIDTMDVDSDYDEVTSEDAFISVTPKGTKQISVDEHVFAQIGETLQRLSLRVEEMQTQLEAKVLPKKPVQIDKAFESSVPRPKRGRVRSKALNVFRVSVFCMPLRDTG